MTPQQALNLVDKIFSEYQGTRQDHINLQVALQVLNETVDNNDNKSKDKIDKPAKKS